MGKAIIYLRPAVMLILLCAAAGGAGACSRIGVTPAGAAVAVPGDHEASVYPDRIQTAGFISRSMMEEILAAGEYDPGQEGYGPLPGEGNIRCLTLPHHLPAAGLCVYALQQVAAREEPPSVVILLGPNHANSGPAAAVTSALWQTPYATVEPENEAIETLTDRGMAENDSAAFEREHSIGMLIPWVARFLPGAKVVPLIFHYQYSTDKLKEILDALGPWFDEGALLIVSADFSHHQTRDEAERKDRRTARLIEQGDWRSVALLGSDYIDCPTLAAALIRFAQERAPEGPTVIAHTNTGFLTGATQTEITSYFVLAYCD